MNTLPSTPPDALDRLLSDFFKGQMKRPWPAAPATSAGLNGKPVGIVEPASLLGARNATSRPELAHPRVVTASPEPGSRARLTLAASVAILLGSCWYLSNGPWAPASHSAPAAKSGPSANPFGEASADGNPIFEQHDRNKATRPAAPMPKIEDAQD